MYKAQQKYCIILEHLEMHQYGIFHEINMQEASEVK